ncbi:competence protein ComJ [Lampropedia cohaerens]|uniref:Ribosomal RNA large subunit methyltransferase J n=1 Tax=Lampropedia cohaerens TaxID=1610491 RepID=A0A0U1Q027_9BURK|nr:23S rRNA (adenine(2030)-N(6))-methyltransferase RlmJ [Lampropedia cohaerens]KKW68118.1 competence protein ComJ [Lampropedia cohaerens]
MFSYRHAFHAGNHADVLKHITLLATLAHLTQKDTALSLIDTHAGCGLYRLDGDFAQTSNESDSGIARLWPLLTASGADASTQAVPEALQRYLTQIAQFNELAVASGKSPRIYPGSPALLQAAMRAQDSLHAFELQPADMRALQGNLQQGPHQRRVRVWHEDGWAGSLRLLPPPSRRALVLCDPSYEIKSDYAQAARWLGDALRKFVTGTYIIWYPIIARPEAHELPRRLKALARQAGRGWLQATLAVRSGSTTGVRIPGEKPQRTGLVASGVTVVNPPYTLKPQLEAALPQLVALLGQDHQARHELTVGEAT